MKLFHGSTLRIEAPRVDVGRRHLDFGPGFYLTDLREQAERWACRPANAGKTHVLNVYEWSFAAAAAPEVRYRRFPEYDDDWLDFVVDNRRGGRAWEGFDIVEGGIANDRVFNTVELYAAGLTPKEDTLRKLRLERPNNQICILSQSVLDRFLRFVEAVQLP